MAFASAGRPGVYRSLGDLLSRLFLDPPILCEALPRAARDRPLIANGRPLPARAKPPPVNDRQFPARGRLPPVNDRAGPTKGSPLPADQSATGGSRLKASPPLLSPGFSGTIPPWRRRQLIPSGVWSFLRQDPGMSSISRVRVKAACSWCASNARSRDPG